MAIDMPVWNTTGSAGAVPLSVDLSSMNRAANLDVLAIPQKLVAAIKQSRSIRILHSRWSTQTQSTTIRHLVVILRVPMVALLVGSKMVSVHQA